jgi:hypothetical protein
LVTMEQVTQFLEKLLYPDDNHQQWLYSASNWTQLKKLYLNQRVLVSSPLSHNPWNTQPLSFQNS